MHRAKVVYISQIALPQPFLGLDKLKLRPDFMSKSGCTFAPCSVPYIYRRQSGVKGSRFLIAETVSEKPDKDNFIIIPVLDSVIAAQIEQIIQLLLVQPESKGDKKQIPSV